MRTTCVTDPFLQSSPLSMSGANRLRGGTLTRGKSKLNFAIAGDGESKKICAFQSHSDRDLSTKRRTATNEVEWICSSCTYVNHGSHKFCSMCRHDKKEEKVGQKSTAEKHVTIFREIDNSVATVSTTTEYSEGSNNAYGRFSSAKPTTTLESVHNEEGFSGRTGSSGMSRPNLDENKNSSAETSFRFDDLVTGMQKPSPANRGVSDQEFNMSFGNWSIRDNNAWTCVSCTYVNADPLHLICAVCGQDRVMYSDQDGGENALGESTVLNYSVFNESIVSGQDHIIEKQRQKILELERKAIERERTDELLNMQYNLLDEISRDNEGKRGSETACSQNPASKNKSGRDADSHRNVSSHRNKTDRRDSVTEWESRLEESRKRIEELEKMHREEREEQRMMEEVLRRERHQIETEEGTRVTRGDGKNRSLVRGSSSRVLQLRAQERMLHDWNEQWEVRQHQLEEIRRQQQALLAKYHA